MDAGTLSDGSAVVVPAVGVPSTVACLRSLGVAGIDTIAVAERESIAGFHSRYCDEAVVVPDPDEDLLAYRDALLDVAARPDVHSIVPVREADSFVLSRYRDQFEPRVSLVVPAFETLRSAHDRLALAKAAERADVPHPETHQLSAVEDWSGERLVKSRYNLLTGDYVDSLDPAAVIEVDTIEHLRPGEKPDADRLRSEMHHDPIVQEYVPGEQYMVGALYDHGEPLATVQHHQVRGQSYVGAGGVYRESIADPELARVSRRLLGELDWHGLACLEYMRDERTGEFKLAEINPRMWQSLGANVAMGADFPRYYWLQATGQSDRIDPSYDVGVGCHWLKGEFLHLLSHVRDDSPLVDRPGALSTVRDVATSIARQPNFDYLHRDDLGPFVEDWLALYRAVPGTPALALPGVDATTWAGHARDRPERDHRDVRAKALED